LQSVRFVPWVLIVFYFLLAIDDCSQKKEFNGLKKVYYLAWMYDLIKRIELDQLQSCYKQELINNNLIDRQM